MKETEQQIWRGGEIQENERRRKQRDDNREVDMKINSSEKKDNKR